MNMFAILNYFKLFWLVLFFELFQNSLESWKDWIIAKMFAVWNFEIKENYSILFEIFKQTKKLVFWNNSNKPNVSKNFELKQ